MEVETHSVSSFDLNSTSPFSYSTNLSTDGSEFHNSVMSSSPEFPKSDRFVSPVASGEDCESFDMSPFSNSDMGYELSVEVSSAGEPDSNVSSAAMTVQKVYRSYRTRRMLADSAVVIEELWWQAIDYARLNHSTISFFNFLKPETAASRWSRISLNASKVGKGLSKDAKAQKLAFQHWIEAIDPQHRYGHSLHIYYEEWCKADAGQPFFYWLNLGEGKKVDLKECPRSKLRQQSIKYLGPQERENYEYIVVDGKIVHRQSENLLDTTKGSQGAKWIFVMSTTKRFYAGEKKKGRFHHSSFLAGGATVAAGRLVVEDGTLKSISAYSGHYRPTDDSLDSFLSFLKENGVNLNEVEIRKPNEDYDNYEEIKSNGDGNKAEVPKVSESPQPEISNEEKDSSSEQTEVPPTATKNNYKRTLSGGIQSPRGQVSKTAILERINSKKIARSYQLGKQLSLTWSTGAGPRIGCVADYPVELRLQALEFTNLTPRTSPTSSYPRRIAGLASPTACPSPNTQNGVSMASGV